MVLISGSNVGTVTGKEGTAQISAAPGNELVISYVGCQTRKVRVSDKSGAESFEITLETESNKLDPVSVTPGDQKNARAPKRRRSRKGAESQTALYRRRRRADEHRRDRPQYDRTDQRPQKSVLHRSVRFAG
ncbi:MAG: carboxypeptidase-like regulatory domain-containing protein [Alistipes shahii]|uniref:carboxypeptidase-like regulatory domain-containing protein n=1 Tax=Alistipes shahii TaxID=328814 RepID=UPI00399CC8C2